jgi:predicted ester cyclase
MNRYGIKNHLSLIVLIILVIFGCTQGKKEKSNKDIVMRAWEEGFNQGKMDVIRELFDESYIELTPYDTIAQGGVERPLQAYEWMQSVFGDIHFEVEQMLAEGDFVFSRVMATGNHVGKFLGVPATNRPVKFAAVVVSKIANGKHVQDWSFIDSRAILKQIDNSKTDQSREEKNKEIIRRLIEEGINEYKLDLFDELLAADFVRYSQAAPPGQERITGIDTYKGLLKEFKAAFPDYQEEMLDMFAEQDKVFIRTRGTATHTGPLGDIPPTKNKLEIENFGVFRLENGRIKEIWVSWDNLAMLRQLGLN